MGLFKKARRAVSSTVKRAAKQATGTVTDTAKALAPRKLSELPSKLFVAPITTPVTVAARAVQRAGVRGSLGSFAEKVDARSTAVQVVADENPATVGKGVAALGAAVVAAYTGGSTTGLAAKLGASAVQDVLTHEATHGKNRAPSTPAQSSAPATMADAVEAAASAPAPDAAAAVVAAPQFTRKETLGEFFARVLRRSP